MAATARIAIMMAQRQFGLLPLGVVAQSSLATHWIGVCEPGKDMRMPASQSNKTESEAVGLFHEAGALQDAIDELLVSGFGRETISLLASETAIEDKLHRHFRSVAELEDDPAVPRAAYVAPESIGDAQGGLIGGFTYLAGVPAAGFIAASGGTLIAIATAAVAAGAMGAAFGTLLSSALGQTMAARVQEHLDHGGLLIWVRTWNHDHEARALDILTKHGAVDVHSRKLD